MNYNSRCWRKCVISTFSRNIIRHANIEQRYNMTEQGFQAKKGAPVYLTTRDVAVLLDLKKRAVAQYLFVTRKHYRDGCVKPFDLPLPDALAGFNLRAPLWCYETIRDWAARRPQAPVELPKSEEDGLALLREYSEVAKD